MQSSTKLAEWIGRIRFPFDQQLAIGGHMPENDYNYAVFNLQAELGKFEEFENLPLHAGRRAPDFPAEDLETAQTVNLKDLWSGSLLIIEFGSYT
jgi:hypothetical protein